MSHILIRLKGNLLPTSLKLLLGFSNLYKTSRVVPIKCATLEMNLMCNFGCDVMYSINYEPDLLVDLASRWICVNSSLHCCTMVNNLHNVFPVYVRVPHSRRKLTSVFFFILLHTDLAYVCQQLAHRGGCRPNVWKGSVTTNEVTYSVTVSFYVNWSPA